MSAINQQPSVPSHVHPGDLITSELINEHIDEMAPSDLSKLPQISNVQVFASNAPSGPNMTVKGNQAAFIQGTNLQDVYLVRIDSVPVGFNPQGGSLVVTTVPAPQNMTAVEGQRQKGIGTLAVTNSNGTGTRIILYA
jgi:hypothetical protein